MRMRPSEPHARFFLIEGIDAPSVTQKPKFARFETNCVKVHLTDIRERNKGDEVTQSKESRDQNDLRKFPMMPIRDMVIFPHMMTPFVVGRESSVRALEEALNGDRKIFLATQHDARVDEPRADEIYTVGTIGNIVQSVKMPDGNIKVLVEGWSGQAPSR